MTATGRRTAIVTMTGLLVAFFLVWSAATGPTGLAEGLPHRPVVDRQTVQTPATPVGTKRRPRTDVAGETRTSYRAQWVHDLAGLTGLLITLWFFGMLLRAVIDLVGPRLRDKQLVVDLDPLPDVAAGRTALTRDRDRHREALPRPTSATASWRAGCCWSRAPQRPVSYVDPQRPPPSSWSASCTPSTSTRDRSPSWPGSTTRRGSPRTRCPRTLASEPTAALQAIHDELAHLEASA